MNQGQVHREASTAAFRPRLNGATVQTHILSSNRLIQTSCQGRLREVSARQNG